MRISHRSLAGLESLLTTVDKGVGDAEQEPADRNLAELAFEVTRRAIDAARSLRDDAGVVPG